MESMSRRTFLGTGAVAVGTLAATTAARASEAADEGREWDETYDVVILGAGGAGLTAGIEACRDDSQASVLVLEKQAITGGNTALCGGNIGALNTDLIEAAAKENPDDDRYTGDTVDLYAEDKLATGDYCGDPELARVFAANSHDNYEWLKSLGLSWKSAKPYEGVTYVPSDFENALLLNSSAYLQRYGEDGTFRGVARKVRYNGTATYGDLKRGAAIAQCLADTFAACGNGELRTGWPLVSIVREKEHEGEVLGVVAEDPDGVTKTVRALRGVVLATGGYSANPAMIHTHAPKVPEAIQPYGATGLTGDGLVAAQWLGAQVVNMSYPQIDFGNPSKFYVSFTGRKALSIFDGPGCYIDVASDGTRIWNEFPSKAPQYVDARLTRLDQLGISTWWSLGDAVSVEPDELTEDDVTDFTDNVGAVFDTLDEVAAYIGAEPSVLRETVDRYNGFVDAQVDSDYGKPAVYLTQRIEKAPFYVFEAGLRCLSTPGGLRIDADARVLDIAGNPIPRLFAAGEVTGNVHGRFRNAGGDSMTDNTCFGRIAGANVVALEPLE